MRTQRRSFTWRISPPFEARYAIARPLCTSRRIFPRGIGSRPARARAAPSPPTTSTTALPRFTQHIPRARGASGVGEQCRHRVVNMGAFPRRARRTTGAARRTTSFTRSIGSSAAASSRRAASRRTSSSCSGWGTRPTSRRGSPRRTSTRTRSRGTSSRCSCRRYRASSSSRPSASTSTATSSRRRPRAGASSSTSRSSATRRSPSAS